jgi:mono/diheme cytochrome c family protein
MAVVVAIVALLIIHFNAPLMAQSVDRSALTGKQLYEAACVACHGNDGRGQPIAVRGFDIDLPDFTDCGLTTPEADLDWLSVVHQGGSARSFDRRMPAFGDELTEAEILLVIGHVRRFCAEPGWPRGDLNLPRPFVTEKAFPENEAVLTTTIVPSHERSVSNQFLYEHRVGRRGQYELFVPLDFQQSAASSWQMGVGDIGAAYKHVLYDSLSRGSIVSAVGEVALPSGSESKGLGKGVAMFEAFGTVSQVLPSDGFLHAHAGVEAPADAKKAAKETFWRLAVGKSFMEHRWGRAWSPMVEILGARELEDGSKPEWDVLPQVQVSLSNRQHVLMNIGVRTPISQRSERRTSLLVYVLWDWFDGGFFSGW